MVIQLGQSCPGSFNFNCSDNFNNGEFPFAHFTNTSQYDQACGHLLVCFYGNTMIKCNDKHEERPYSVLEIKPKDLTITVDYPPWFVPPVAPTYDPCKTYLDLSSSIPLFQSVSLFIDGPGENETFIGCLSNPDWDKYRGQANKKGCGSAVDGDHAIVYGPYDYGQLPKGNPPPTGCMQFHNTYSSAAEAKGKSRTLLILVVVLSVIAVGVAILIVIIIYWRRRNSKTGLRPLPSRLMSLNHTTSDLEDGSTNNGVTVFSYAELQEVTNNFDPARELGEGGFGVVYHGLGEVSSVGAASMSHEQTVNSRVKSSAFKSGLANKQANKQKVIAAITHFCLSTWLLLD